MRQSPCASCKHGHKSKHKTRCRDCDKRIAYVDSLERAPECRSDPCYQAAYSMSADAAKYFNSQSPISAWSLYF